MTPGRFLKRNQQSWKELEALLRQQKSLKDPKKARQFLPLYRRLCQNLSLARYRHYSPKVIAQLNRLALLGHERMYGANRASLSGLVGFLTHGFPRAFRAEIKWFWYSVLLFAAPAVVLYLAVMLQPDLVYSVLSQDQVEMIESMYPAGAEQVDREFERQSDSDFYAFSKYILNNVTICFRMFSGGAFFCLGTLFFLIYNGVYLGVVFAHVHNIGGGVALNSFVIAHGAFEITGLVISSMAGLRLGWALVAPGRMTRAASLRQAAPIALRILAGAAVMVAFAAVIEAYWSPRTFISPQTKYLVGGLLWLLVILYLSMAGRRRHGS